MQWTRLGHLNLFRVQRLDFRISFSICINLPASAQTLRDKDGRKSVVKTRISPQ